MIRLGLAVTAALFFLLAGACSLVHQHRRIASPPGCSQCHQEQIEGNWHVLFKPATIHDETDSGRAEINASGRPPRDSEWRRCFSCHHTPAKDHAFYRGLYDH